MSYPPQEGYPAPVPQPPVAQPPAAQYPAAQHPIAQPTGAHPTVQYPVQPQAVSAAPAYQPALPQISGIPYGQPEARRKSTVLVLAIAAGFLLVFGGLMFGLYVNERGNLSDTKAEMSDTRADLSAQVQEQKALVTEQEEKLALETKRAEDLDKQLQANKTSLANVTAQRDVLVPCMRRIQDAFDAAADGDSAGLTRALRSARTACDKAETKMDS